MNQKILHTKLYGRKREIAQLQDAYELVSSGAARIMLIPGHSGAGKTALVEELRESVNQKNGFFIQGKFEQYQQNIPYFALRQAITGFCKNLENKTEHESQKLRNRIIEAVGNLGQILVDFVPELEGFIGPQPPVGEISPQEARYRFIGVFQDFLKAICQPEHPVVFFIDDWQWSDPASNDLLRRLAFGTTLRYVVFIAAFRNNEMKPKNPFFRAIKELKSHGIEVEEIPIYNISDHNIKEILHDIFTPKIARANDLAALLYQKTKGNPFFVKSYLNFFLEKGHLWFNNQTNEWQWKSEIPLSNLPTRVVDLFALKFEEFNQEEKDLFFLAASLGNQFSIESLTIISGWPADKIRAVMLSQTAKTMLTGWENKEEQQDSDKVFSLRFLHDKVQQAAFSMVKPEEIPAKKLNIGRLFLSNLQTEQINDRLFEIMNNINSGAHLVDQPDEQLKYIQLNLRASKKAYTATAYQSALQFCRAADLFLHSAEFIASLWEKRHSLMMDLFKQKAECEFIEGDRHEGERIIKTAIGKAKTAIEKAGVLNNLIVYYTLTARYPEAIDAGYSALNAMGLPLPQNNFEKAGKQEIEKVKSALRKQTVASLSEIPDMTDPLMLTATRILISMGPPCYRSHQRLWSVLVPKVVNLIIKHGNIPQAGYSHTAFGGLLAWTNSDFEVARKFGDIATTLMKKRYLQPSDQSIFHLMIGSSIRHWFHHLSHSSKDYTDAYEAGLSGGNLQYAAYAFGHNMYCKYFQGEEIPFLIQEAEHSLEFSKNRHNQWAIDLLEGGLNIFRVLKTGETPPEKVINWKDEHILHQIEKHHNIQVKCIYNILKSSALMFLGNNAEALKISDATHSMIYTVGTQGLLPWPEYVFSRFVILAALYRQVDESSQSKWDSELKKIISQLTTWAKYAPDNYDHKLSLAKAELARIDGNIEEAAKNYDKAIHEAREKNFIQWEALANEKASDFWQKNNAPQIAAIYRQQAYAAYFRWGAKTKIQIMEEKIYSSMHEHLTHLQPTSKELISLMAKKQIKVLRNNALQLQQNRLREAAETQAGELASATERLRVEIAERKKAEYALTQKNEELQTVNATKDKFFSIIAHDLKSPFNAILGFSELLKDKANNLDIEKVKNFSGIINNSANMAMDLLMNLMEWARSQTGRIKYNPEVFMLFPVIEQVKNLLGQQNPGQKNIEILSTVASDIQVYGDKAMINTILRNLVSNALKFTKKGGKITIDALQKQGFIEISVSDTGIGISPEKISKLFKINETYSTPGTENEKGTGLGLILCKEFVQNHGGDIWAESSPGKGSAFRFTIPGKKQS